MVTTIVNDTTTVYQLKKQNGLRYPSGVSLNEAEKRLILDIAEKNLGYRNLSAGVRFLLTQYQRVFDE